MALYLDDNFEMYWDLAVAKAWADEEFKTRLFEDANLALAEIGYNMPRRVDFRVAPPGESYTFDLHKKVTWDGGSSNGDWTNDRVYVVVPFPVAPELDARAFALAKYTDQAGIAPFSTC